MNAATSDFVGVYTSIAPAADCDSVPPSGVATTPAAIASWLSRNPGFAAGPARQVSVGGLQGMVLDLRVKKSWTKTCAYSNGRPIVPLMAGRGPSHLEHNLIPGQVTRLYLLTYEALDAVLAIEVVDITDEKHLNDYSAVVRTFTFNA